MLHWLSIGFSSPAYDEFHAISLLACLACLHCSCLVKSATWRRYPLSPRCRNSTSEPVVPTPGACSRTHSSISRRTFRAARRRIPRPNVVAEEAFSGFHRVLSIACRARVCRLEEAMAEASAMGAHICRIWVPRLMIARQFRRAERSARTGSPLSIRRGAVDAGGNRNSLSGRYRSHS